MEASGSKIKKIKVSFDKKKNRKEIVKTEDQSNNDLTVYLPNHIVEKIFTFLPIKDAVSSSVVAKPFIKSWLYVRNLCFDKMFKLSCSLRGREEIPIIDYVLNNHSGKKIHSFHLYIPSLTEYNFFINRWIQLVASKGIEELELHFENRYNGIYYCMHSDFTDIETLCNLKLIHCHLCLSPKPKGLRFLKSLSMTDVQVAPYFIKALFASCLVLECLALKDCSFIGDLIIKGSDKFTTLSIRGCNGVGLFTINSSNITTFHYDGDINKIKIVNSIRLKDAILNFYPTKGFQHMCERDDLTEVIRDVQTLSISNVLLEGLAPRYVNFEYIDMEYYLLNLKELQLVRRGMSFVNPWDILLFVKNCPQIERLFLDFGRDPMEGGSYWEYVGKERFESCKIELGKLKAVKVKWLRMAELETKLLQKIKNSANSLELLILVDPRNNEQITKFTKHPRTGTTVATHGHSMDHSVFPKHTIL